MSSSKETPPKARAAVSSPCIGKSPWARCEVRSERRSFRPRNSPTPCNGGKRKTTAAKNLTRLGGGWPGGWEAARPPEPARPVLAVQHPGRLLRGQARRPAARQLDVPTGVFLRHMLAAIYFKPRAAAHHCIAQSVAARCSSAASSRTNHRLAGRQNKAPPRRRPWAPGQRAAI